MTNAEKDVHERKITNRTKALKATEAKKIWPQPNLPAQYFRADDNRWEKGLIVGPNDKSGKTWIFISSPSSATWRIVGSDMFHELPAEQHAQFKTDDFRRAGQGIIHYKDKKSDQRRAKADNKALLRSMFGR
jgi:hypothetical protein